MTSSHRHVHSSGHRTEHRRSLALTASTIVVLALALFLGGASRENAWPAAIVEIFALTLLPLAVWSLILTGSWRRAAWPIGIGAGIALVPLVQLIPLPPEVWTSLRGDDLAAATYAALGVPLPWAPLSLTPAFTLRSGLSLIAPLAVFLAVLSLSERARALCLAAVVIVTVLSLVVSVIQLTGGQNSPAYFWSDTNRGSAVGFFANRNHQAGLLLCALPWATALLAGPARPANQAATTLAYLGLSIVVLVALAAVKSRAGVLLAAPAVLVSLAILWRSARHRRERRTLLAFGAAVILALALVGMFGLGPILERFSGQEVDARFMVAPYIWQAAVENLPFGTGLGSFDKAYRAMEPAALMRPAFVNHAHNDYLEVLLETGVMGAAALLAFVAWFSLRVWRIWLRKDQAGVFGQAASVVVALLATHSLVDYPLRTLALSCVFALACALLMPPIGGAGSRNELKS